MTVYIDDMYLHPIGHFRRMKMSHMIAETDEELHYMADLIGVQRQWFQGDHYDISMSKRAEAIKRGAVEVTLKQLAAMVWLKKKTGSIGDPATAIVRMIAQMKVKPYIEKNING